MKLVPFVVAFALITGVAFGHEGNDHVRGVVTDVSATAVTVETAPAARKTLKLTPKTTYQMQGKRAHLADLKVGQRQVDRKTPYAFFIPVKQADPFAHGPSR